MLKILLGAALVAWMLLHVPPIERRAARVVREFSSVSWSAGSLDAAGSLRELAR